MYEVKQKIKGNFSLPQSDVDSTVKYGGYKQYESLLMSIYLVFVMS
jgi:hypothetical protein